MTDRDEELVPGLVRKDGRLTWSGVELGALARTHGTPLHVVNHAVLRQRAGEIAGALDDAGLTSRVFFSVKTNPLHDVLAALGARGIGAEVSSSVERWLAARAGLTGAQLVVGGSVIDDDELDAVLALGPALLNVESLDDVDRVIARAPTSGPPVALGLRLNPAAKAAPWDLLAHSGSARSHFGIPVDAPALDVALDRLVGQRHVELRALHVHIGTNLPTAEPWARALPAIVDVWRRALDRGLAPRVLDVGGGFPARASHARGVRGLWRALVSARAEPASTSPPPTVLADVARAIVDAFTAAGLAVPEIFVEPGRAIVGDAMLTLVTIQRVTSTPRGDVVAIADGGALGLSPLLLVEEHPLALVDRDPPERVDVAVQGPMPTSLDLLSPAARLPPLAPGDVLAVIGTGGYFTSMATTFAGPRAAIVAIDDDGAAARVVRRRETREELVARDVPRD